MIKIYTYDRNKAEMTLRHIAKFRIARLDECMDYSKDKMQWLYVITIDDCDIFDSYVPIEKIVIGYDGAILIDNAKEED